MGMSTYEKFYGQFEHGFFAGSTLGVLVQSCIGGIAAMAVLENGARPLQMLQLFLVVALSVSYNGSILSQQKPKVVFNLLLWSIGINLLVAVINFAG
jgi:hypothetical protein